MMAATGNLPPENYQAQSDMHTLMQAHKIKSDPKRHAAAKAHAKGQMDAMKAVSTEVKAKK